MIIIFLPLPLGGGVGERWTLREGVGGRVKVQQKVEALR
jgi:hypothetical protein